MNSAEILKHHAYIGALWLDTRRHWDAATETKLRILCEAGADVNHSADALGRSPTSIAHRAKDTGLPIPRSWLSIITPKRIPIVVPRINLSYPFIIGRRNDTADLLTVNSLVPQYLMGREDVCQEIMLALWEGKVTLDQLKANRALVSSFIRKSRRDNYESNGYAISLDQPMRDGGSWHDVLAYSNE
jgi:hypothetical protein